MTTYDSINKVNCNKTAIYNHGLFSTENKKEEPAIHNSKLKAFMEGGLQKNQNYLDNSKLCYIDKYDFQHPNKHVDNYQLSSILSGSLNKQEAEEGVSAFGTMRGMKSASAVESKIIADLTPESKALSKIALEAKSPSNMSKLLKNTRGAAYMNDVGEGLKPTVGQAIAKRCWYPALLYVGASVYNKTRYDKYGNKDFSLRRGGTELAFQALASLCGPILLVNIGQNTIGKALSKTGSLVKSMRNSQNPFKNINSKTIKTGFRSFSVGVGKGIWNGTKSLPKEIGETFTLAFKDLTHPLKTFGKIKNTANKTGAAIQKLPLKFKNLCHNIKSQKMGFIFGKNGILFGQKGLFGEKGLLFGPRSSLVIGGLLGIILLYKQLDKLAAKAVRREE